MADYFHLGIFGQEVANSLTGKGFVVYDQGSYSGRSSHYSFPPLFGLQEVATPAGISIVTSRPLLTALVSSNRWASP
jgi:hypothetical protein